MLVRHFTPSSMAIYPSSLHKNFINKLPLQT